MASSDCSSSGAKMRIFTGHAGAKKFGKKFDINRDIRYNNQDIRYNIFLISSLPTAPIYKRESNGT